MSKEAVFKCPHCGQACNGSREDIGAEAECPSCGNAFILKAVGGAFEKRPSGIMCFFGIFRRYFGFKGRMPRRDFWWAFLFWLISYFVSAVVDMMIWESPDRCAALFLLGTMTPLVAAQVRRLHDTGKSGWWVLLIFLCPINIAYFVWLATAGDKGQNRFGVDPKER